VTSVIRSVGEPAAAWVAMLDEPVVAPATAAGAGTSAADPVPWGGSAEALAAGGCGENIDGRPLCLFQASHSRTSDKVNTIHRMVRRISVMETTRW
jgi:hypothetical protein